MGQLLCLSFAKEPTECHRFARRSLGYELQAHGFAPRFYFGRHASNAAARGSRSRDAATRKFSSWTDAAGDARASTACIAPKSAAVTLRSAGRGKRMIFAQMAGLLAMPTLLPEGVLSAEGEDAQAVNSS